MQTMSFMQLLQKIVSWIPSSPGLDPAKLARLNPDHIELENVRSLLGVSSTRARMICETAVRRGVFRKRIQILCPDDVVALSVDMGTPVPPTVRCREEIDGLFEIAELPTATLRKVEFYCLSD
jgi:hypothetical protein